MTSNHPDGAATIDTAGLRERLAAGVGPRIIDVRTAAEFETVHIPGAYNVPLDLLREHLAELRRRLDEDVVLAEFSPRAGKDRDASWLAARTGQGPRPTSP